MHQHTTARKIAFSKGGPVIVKSKFLLVQIPLKHLLSIFLSFCVYTAVNKNRLIGKKWLIQQVTVLSLSFHSELKRSH